MHRGAISPNGDRNTFRWADAITDAILPPPVTELTSSLLLFAALLGTAWGCLHLQRLLPEHHRSRETADFVRLVITMLITFAALVLGLMTTSVKADFDGVADDVRTFATQIIDLNRLLVEYGPETAATRTLLRDYTAAAVTTTWTDETPPNPKPSVGSAALGQMLTNIGKQLLALETTDPTRQSLATEARARFDAVLQRRWKLVEDGNGEPASPFYAIMVLWLIIIFASFGLTAPRNMLVFVTVTMCAASLASVVFVILDLGTPFTGFFVVPSAPLRAAILTLSQ
jgi:hypothetical protein